MAINGLGIKYDPYQYFKKAQAEKTEKNDGDVNTDSGIELSTEHTDGEQAESASDIPVTYTKTGKTVPSNPEIKFSVSV